jgi:phospholipid-translocating ATPase
MAFPQLYIRGILGLDYTRGRFWLYMLDGLYQSAIIFFIPLLVYWDGMSWSASGRDTNDLYDLSSCIAIAGVFAANLYVGINTRYWTVIPAVVIPVSILAAFLWTAVYSSIAPLDYSGVVEVIFPTVNFWATVLLTVFLAVGPHWVAKAFRQSYFYRDKDIIREAWIGGDLKDQLGIKHRKRRNNKNNIDLENPQYSHYLKDQDAGQYQSPPQIAAPLLETKGYPGPTDSPQPQSPTQGYNPYAPPPPALVFEPPTQDTDPYGGSPYGSPQRTPYSSPPPSDRFEERRGSNASSTGGIAAPQPVRSRNAPAQYAAYDPNEVDVFASGQGTSPYSAAASAGSSPYPTALSSRSSHAPSDSERNGKSQGRPPYTGYAM